MDLRGPGIAVPKGRINIPREPKPRAEDTIMVFAEGQQADEAKRAGAQIVGGTELIEGVGVISSVYEWTMIFIHVGPHRPSESKHHIVHAGTHPRHHPQIRPLSRSYGLNAG
jgi:hypothetical protein